MKRNLPATLLALTSGAAVSVASGMLLASYVVSGIAPAYAAPPRLASAHPVALDGTDDSAAIPPLDFAGPLPTDPH